MPLFNQEISHIPTNLTNECPINPFSVMRKTTGIWTDRKHEWESLGIESAEGRDTKRYNAMPTNISGAKYYDTEDTNSISTFDPVICEVVYKWFSKKGDRILDPFAGGSVRGAVASLLGRKYTGIDLSQTQVLANSNQINKLMQKYIGMSTADWYVGDSEYVLDDLIALEEEYDLLFTCPPYYNLEQYTRDSRDLSRQATYDSFLYKYTTILTKACSCLKPNSFCAIVVGEIRDKNTGEYYGLVPDTINIFKKAGLHYYNEIIIEDPIASLPLRGPKYFNQSRKIGKHHQNLLLFYKGEMSEIRKKCEILNSFE